ncbi:MAG: DUF5686 family protein [Bacteroidetes bacterium]|nr:DUF5686 family protein [Bacteroidota bacterium]
MKKTKALFLLFQFVSVFAFAQTLKITGRIIDGETREVIPFSNVILKSTLTGTMADSAGNFRLTIAGRRDTLVVSALGYIDDTIAVSPLTDQLLTIPLEPNAFHLTEVTVKMGENPAFEILRRVIANKPINNPDEKESYEYEVYHKVEFDLNNFTDKIKRNIFLRSFSFIFDNTDTTSDSIPYLPILFNESLSDFYYRKNPPSLKEVVKGRRAVGLKGPKIVQFAQDMYLTPNIYNDYVLILDKNFPSPLSDNYKSNYKFMLLDSLQFKGSRCYHISFHPKIKADVAFTGDMYIDDLTYAVKQIDLSFSIAANVNFVRNYWIRQEYGIVDGSHNMMTKSRVIADFTVAENSKEMTGFFGRKTSDYRNYKVNQPHEDKFYAGHDRVTFNDSAATRTETYWNDARGDSLTKQEQGVFDMIDTLEKVPKFVLLKNSVNAFTTGWIPFGQLDLGDFYSFYSYNKVEEHRIKFGLRGRHLANEKVDFKTYLAYGLGDKRTKYLAEASYILSRHQSKRNTIGGSIRYDAVQPGRSSNILQLDNVFTSFISTAPLEFRSLVKETGGWFERQWFTGFSTRIGVKESEWKPFGDYHYRALNELSSPDTIQHFTLSGIEFSARFAFGERNLSAKFGEGTEGLFFPKYPVISFNYFHGMKDFLNGTFSTEKIKLRIEEKLRMRKLGYMLVRVEGGKTTGTLPWVFLETPIANQLVLNDETAFNLMNYMEFVSDQYASGMIEQHFEGLLFNRIPLIKKLKWREFIFAKMYAGTLSDANNQGKYLFPEAVGQLNEPYVEVGFGIENIFKISRVDFTWRLNYTDKPDVYYFIAKPSFQFKF